MITRERIQITNEMVEAGSFEEYISEFEKFQEFQNLNYPTQNVVRLLLSYCDRRLTDEELSKLAEQIITLCACVSNSEIVEFAIFAHNYERLRCSEHLRRASDNGTSDVFVNLEIIKHSTEHFEVTIAPHISISMSEVYRRHMKPSNIRNPLQLIVLECCQCKKIDLSDIPILLSMYN